MSEPIQSIAPAVRFEDFGLSTDILRALADQGYVHPTPIQAEAIPIVLQGRDVMGAAQTGTGKTAGFSLPIIHLLPKQRQNLMFSATFSNEIKKLASSFLADPVTIEVARGNSTAENVTQIVYKVGEADKRDAVSYIIRERGLKQVIVFSNSKIGASRLARQVEQEGVNATAIHGDKSQSERMAALDAFKQGQVEVLVATDVAARGLDIAELPCVINFDLPYNAEDYVHRIGRTGRAGASGDAISLFSDKDERLLVDIEKMIKYKFVPAQLIGFV